MKDYRITKEDGRFYVWFWTGNLCGWIPLVDAVFNTRDAAKARIATQRAYNARFAA